MNFRKLNLFLLFSVMSLLFLSLASAQQGDARRGELLYVGTKAFSAGGAPCLACHGIAGHELGHAAGASYGPDLTTMYEDFGEDGVVGVLEDLSFEGMAAIYETRPLTDEEKADLVAFFATASSGSDGQTGSGLALHVTLATIVIFIIFGLFGWRRLQGVRRPLVERAAQGKGGVA